MPDLPPDHPLDAPDPRGNPDALTPPPGREWFAPVDPRTGEAGLRFQCTMCGNCCTGPEGYVLVSDAEIAALAARFSLSPADFTDRYTHQTIHGRSLVEHITPLTPAFGDGQGRDCVFLDRTTIPGKAICGVYEDRPAQCRTWPFWPSLLKERKNWERAKRTCPGIDAGTLIPIEEVRIRRDAVRI